MSVSAATLSTRVEATPLERKKKARILLCKYLDRFSMSMQQLLVGIRSNPCWLCHRRGPDLKQRSNRVLHYTGCYTEGLGEDVAGMQDWLWKIQIIILLQINHITYFHKHNLTCPMDVEERSITDLAKLFSAFPSLFWCQIRLASLHNYCRVQTCAQPLRDLHYFWNQLVTHQRYARQGQVFWLLRHFNSASAAELGSCWPAQFYLGHTYIAISFTFTIKYKFRRLWATVRRTNLNHRRQLQISQENCRSSLGISSFSFLIVLSFWRRLVQKSEHHFERDTLQAWRENVMATDVLVSLVSRCPQTL